MRQPTDHTTKAAQCRKLAEQAKADEDRQRWLAVEQFWLKQTGPGKFIPEDEKPELVKL